MVDRQKPSHRLDVLRFYDAVSNLILWEALLLSADAQNMIDFPGPEVD